MSFLSKLSAKLPGTKKPRSNEEEKLQHRIIKWHYESGVFIYPELKWLHHIRNGGKLEPKYASYWKQQGVKAGIPDLFLPVKRGEFSGFYIELKANQYLSKEQKEFRDFCIDQGYQHYVFRIADTDAETTFIAVINAIAVYLTDNIHDWRK